jgi:hypothetical protein
MTAAAELGCMAHIADLTDPAQVGGLFAAVGARWARSRCW